MARTTESPSVSVVIPTRLRPELARAIASVRQQVYDGPVVIVVVVDTTNSEPEVSEDVRRALNEVTVVRLEGGQGAATARNAGIEAASGRWIAFLDDDDAWEPNHLAVTIAEGVRRGGDVLIASRAHQVVDAARLNKPTPSRVLPEGRPVGDYLFRRRSPSIGRPSLFTSTFVTTRTAAKRVPWQVNLSRHQDWDWLLRMEESGVPIVQVADATAQIWVGSRGSISASSDWRSSLVWARQQRVRLSKRAYVDFLVAQTLRYAIQGRSFEGVRLVGIEVLRTRRVPWPGAMAFALAAIVPRRLAFRALAGRARTKEIHATES